MPRSAFCLLLLFCPAPAVADNWPEFRGPTGQGHAAQSKPPLTWDATKNVTWKQPIPGLAWSSPIIHDGRIFLTTAVTLEDTETKDISLRALGLDLATGKQLWDEEIFRQNGKTAPRIHNKNSHASPTPITDGQRLYVHFGHLGTACLDLAGKVLWRTQEIKYAPVHGNGGTPILAAGKLIFSCDGGNKQFVVALDAQTGKIAWQTPRGPTETARKFAFATPLLITVNQRPQVISQGANAVWAYDPDTGKELWRANYEGGYSTVPRPVFAHGLLYICTGYDTPRMFAVRPDGQGDVTKTHVAWEMQKGSALTPSVVVVGDELYTISDQGIASCVDAKTGKVHWQERVGGTHSASPLYADGKVYFQSEQGQGIVIKAATKFEVLARNALNERSLASYAVHGNALLIRTEKHLFRIEEAK